MGVSADQLPGFTDKALLARLLRENKGGGFRMVIGVMAIVPALIYGGLVGTKLVSRWLECSRAVEQGLTATDWCLKEEREFQQRRYKPGPFDEAKERRSCGWRLRERKLTDADTHAFCFGGHYEHGGWKKARQLGLLAGLPLVGGLGLFFWGWWRRRRGPAFLRVLRDTPEKVVWVYVFEVRVRYGGSSRTVQLGLHDGREVMIHLGANDSHDQTLAVVANIAPMVPWATLGYSDEKKAQFRRNPIRLKRQ